MPIKAAAVVLAGGTGSRVQRDVNKVYLPIRERDMPAYSLETMDRSPRISPVVPVVREEDSARAETLIGETMPSKPSHVVVGGPSRHLSEMAGLEAIGTDIENGEIDIVAIHDGARPFMTPGLLDRLIDAALESGGAIPVLPIEEPLYRTTADSLERLPPDTLRRVQTPQVFRAIPLLSAYRQSLIAVFQGVDTAETVERFSDLEVRALPGDLRNIKVAFIEDFFAAEDFALKWDRGPWRG